MCHKMGLVIFGAINIFATDEPKLNNETNSTAQNTKWSLFCVKDSTSTLHHSCLQNRDFTTKPN